MRGRPKAATIYEVAKRAGVSISTVSLVWNAPHRVRAATRERVVAAAAELGYRSGGDRSAAASGLIRIVVAAPFATYPSYYARLTGILERARDLAVEIVPFNLPSAAAAAEPLLDAVPARRGIDGVIVMGVPLGTAALRASRTARLPVVAVDVRRAVPRDDGVPVVLVDDRAGGRLLGEHLRSRGHDRAVFLHEPQRSREYVSAGMLRAAGLMESVEPLQLPVPLGQDPGPALLAALRSSGARAVVANHDRLAARAILALRAAGQRVPEDVAVTGYDDGDLAEALGLTTVAQPFEASGKAALETVLALVADAEASVSRIQLMPSLVVRETT